MDINNTPHKQDELSASKLAETLNRNTELNISQLTFISILNSSQILEKFSTWLLAGIGATCALIIANINNITNIIEPPIIKYSLLVLALAGLLGFLCKYYNIQIQALLELDEIMRNKFPGIMSAHIAEEKQIHEKAIEQGISVHTIPDIYGAMRKAFESAPWFRKKRALKGFDKGAKDPLFGYHRGMRFLCYQIVVTALEFICFLVFIVMVAFNL